MKYILATLLCASLLSPVAAHADLLLEGEHPVENCVIIENTSEYSAYDIYSENVYRRFWVTPMSEGEVCGLFPTGFLAVKKANQKKITHAENEEMGDPWFTLEENSDYIVRTNEVIPGATRTLPDVNPTVKITHQYRIESVTDVGMDVALVSTIREDKNGKKTVEKEVLTDTDGTNKDFETKTDNEESMMPLLVVVLVCLGAIGLVAATKTWKK